jgi:hypothetical protein
MTDFQPHLLFPFRDAFARKQFLIACLIMLAGTLIPVIPLLILMGYSACIMRQIIEQTQDPSMPEWQQSKWGELLSEGARMLAVRLVYTLPILILMGCGAVFLFTGLFSLTSSSDGSANSQVPLGGISIIAGLGFFLLAFVLSFPFAIIIGAAESHTVIRCSFTAGFRVAEWWPIFRNSLGFFLGAYAFTVVAGLILSLVLQIATVTIVLICALPFITVGSSTYLTLVVNALFANAYAAGRRALNPIP